MKGQYILFAPVVCLPLVNQPGGCAHKKGEVVEPAGGETGVPRCLAEVRKPLHAASFHYFKVQNLQILICPNRPVK